MAVVLVQIVILALFVPVPIVVEVGSASVVGCELGVKFIVEMIMWLITDLRSSTTTTTPFCHTRTPPHFNNDRNGDNEDENDNLSQDCHHGWPQNRVGAPLLFSTNGLKLWNWQWWTWCVATKVTKAMQRVALGDGIVNDIGVVKISLLPLSLSPMLCNLMVAPIRTVKTLTEVLGVSEVTSL